MSPTTVIDPFSERRDAIRNPAAQAIHFFRFDRGVLVDLAIIGTPATRDLAVVIPGIRVRPPARAAAADAMQEDVIFQLVRLVQRDAGQPALDQRHDRIVRPILPRDLKTGAGELNQRMMRRRAAAVDEVGDLVLAKTGGNQLFVVVDVTHEEGYVAEANVFAKQRANPTRGGVDFGATIGGFDQFDRIRARMFDPRRFIGCGRRIEERKLLGRRREWRSLRSVAICEQRSLNDLQRAVLKAALLFQQQRFFHDHSRFLQRDRE
jgi:hypothetical protein